MGELITTAANRVTVTNPGDVPREVWAEFCDAVGHAVVSGGPSHIELEVATAMTWLWWFATAGAGTWHWDPAVVAMIEREVHHTIELDETLALTSDRQAVWPETAPSIEQLALRRTLTPEQRRDVARMIRLGGGANFSVPGAGKTTMAYVTWAAMRQSGQIERCIIVAPLSAHEAWRDEPAMIFEPTSLPIVNVRPSVLRGDVVVVNYETLESPEWLGALQRWCRTGRTLVVFDEAHRAKAGNAGVRGQAAKSLASVAAKRMVLTGTPRPNSVQDLVNILDLAYPGRGRELSENRPVMLHRAFTRMTKSDLRLPPLIVATQHVPMSPAHDRVYDAMTDAAARAYIADPQLAYDVARGGRIVMLLLQAATDPTAVLDAPGELSMIEDRADMDLQTLLRTLPQSFTPTKYVRVAQLVDQHHRNGTKVLVWACFRHHVEQLAKLLAPYSPAIVNGGVPVLDASLPTDRAREIERFRHDPSCAVLVATPHTLAEGISLHHVTTHQIHVDRTYNAGMFLQSLDRTHRLGLPAGAACTATFLNASRLDGALTVDDLVASRLDAKVAAMGRILDDPNLDNLAMPSIDDALTSDDILLGPVHANDLEILFSHLASSRRNPP